MAAIVTDQFRINNASNFLGDVNNSSNSYYVFVGLSNPGISNAFGRSDSNSDWNSSTPNPTDDFNYLNHNKDTIIFGKKITTDNIRRVIRKITWTSGNRYEIYRHDYNSANSSPITDSSRLYDANYFVINKDYNVYICIDNGSSGINKEGNRSQNEPLFTGLEPTRAAGSTDDGYIWKFLFSVSPSDIIKFDATEFIPLPNDWESSIDAQITAVRDNGNADVNSNQLKNVYIADQGNGYSGGTGQEFNIVGDGSGAKVIVDVVGSKITNTQVSVGGKGYTYGMVDLTSISSGAVSNATPAKLIPIIPPSKGHGYDLYKELGADRVLVYARFDDSTKDFPIDTKFAQIGIIKNPNQAGSSTTVFTEAKFSSLSGIKFSSVSGTLPTAGNIIRQTVSNTNTAKGYVASYDAETKVLKYFQDRSLFFNQNTDDQTDFVGVSTSSKIEAFESSANPVTTLEGFTGVIDTTFTDSKVNPTGTKVISLDTEFTSGLSIPEINKGTGDIIYIDNRPLISRNARQKEDIKVILEF